MRSPFMKGVLLGSVVAVAVTMTGTAFAGSGIGAVFNLGKTNTANKTTTLAGTTSDPALQVTNKGAGAALGLTVKAGKAPLTVNSSAKVANLNADTVDGMHASDLTGNSFVSRVTVPSGETSDLATVPGFGLLKAEMTSTDVLYPEFDNTANSETVQVMMGWHGELGEATPGSSFQAAYDATGGTFDVLLADSQHVATVQVWWWGTSNSVHVVTRGNVN